MDEIEENYGYTRACRQLDGLNFSLCRARIQMRSATPREQAHGNVMRLRPLSTGLASVCP